MKKLFLLLVLAYPLISVAQHDDIYFVPTKKSANSEEQTTDRTASVVQNVEENSSSYFMDEDEYNRRYTSSSNVAPAEEYEYEEYVAEEKNPTRTYVLSDDEDYRYTTRLVRFHSPRSVLLSSPWYWDTIGYNNWTIYDNGLYWDIYPDDYYYYPSWSWGYHSPYYYNWGYWNGCGYYGYNYYWWHNHHHHHRPRRRV